MASRAQQKEQARQRRLAEERARAERARRQRRLQMVLGVVVAAVAVAVIAIAVSSSGNKSPSANPTSAAAKASANTVNGLLAGIPQSGNRLGASTAKVTVTEFGDLECPVCASFATSSEDTLIKQDVRPGKVNLVYRSLCTATCNGPNQSQFPAQQAAALAAGEQGRAWNYIELFYREQGQEGTSYVNDAYLNGLAKQIPGLNYKKWLSDRSSSTLVSQVTSDQQQAQAKGFTGTPTIVVQGPKGTAQPITNGYDYSTIESAIKSVS
jgi:protein-disulfide isomerase